MGGELEVEDRRAVGIAEETVVSEESRQGLDLSGFQLVVCEEVAQGAHLAVDDHTQVDSFVVEVLDYQGLVVVGEEGYLPAQRRGDLYRTGVRDRRARYHQETAQDEVCTL